MGRGLPAGQSESRAPLALIGPEEFVRRAWPSEDPIGQRVGFDRDANGNFRWREVVGVIRHQKKHYDLSTIGREQVYFPVGIYGVISYSVAQRAHEIGVCMALGARSQDVVTMVLKQGVGLVAIGLGVGTAAAFALTRVMQTLLFEVSASDPVTYVVVGAILLVVGTAASLLPARRATRVEAVSVLTTE